MSPIDRLVFIQLTIAFPVFAQGLPVTPADQAAGQAWWAHIKLLADDGMQGRLTQHVREHFVRNVPRTTTSDEETAGPY